jgi:hypothetical protein
MDQAYIHLLGKIQHCKMKEYHQKSADEQTRHIKNGQFKAPLWCEILNSRLVQFNVGTISHGDNLNWVPLCVLLSNALYDKKKRRVSLPQTFCRSGRSRTFLAMHLSFNSWFVANLTIKMGSCVLLSTGMTASSPITFCKSLDVTSRGPSVAFTYK